MEINYYHRIKMENYYSSYVEGDTYVYAGVEVEEKSWSELPLWLFS